MGRPTAVRASAASHPGPSFTPCDDDGMEGCPLCRFSIQTQPVGDRRALARASPLSLSRREGSTILDSAVKRFSKPGSPLHASSRPFGRGRPRPGRGPAFPTQPREEGVRPRRLGPALFSEHASIRQRACMKLSIRPGRRTGGLHVKVARNCQQAAGSFHLEKYANLLRCLCPGSSGTAAGLGCFDSGGRTGGAIVCIVCTTS